MAYCYYNPNPKWRTADDCVVRTICALFGFTWDEAYWEICKQGAIINKMPSANHVWGEYLRVHGFTRISLPDFCPNCYTISIFCERHRRGRYAVATGTHVVAVIDGNYYDTTDSGDEVVAYYWKE